MKLLILSDSHGYLRNAMNVIEKLQNRISGVIHLGDHDTDAEALSKKYTSLDFYWVKGNNDFGGSSPFERTLKFDGKKILLTHGHRQQVHWNYDGLSYFAEEQGADVVLFGHTHVPMSDRGGRVWLFNPGSISLPRMSSIPTFGILSLEEGRMELSIMQYLGADNFKRMD